MLKFLFGLLLMLPTLVSAKPQVYLDYKTYYTPTGQPFIETMLQFVSPTFKFIANADGNLVSSVEITQVFKIGDSIVLVDKYIVNSPEMLDSTIEDYYDIKRYQLKAGNYDVEIIITDLSNNESVSGIQGLIIKPQNNSKINFSSVEFIQSVSKSEETSNFVKNGYFILPYLVNYFPPELEKIATYLEIYNTNLILGVDEKFMLTTEIQNYKTGQMVEGFFKVKKYSSNKVVPVILFLPIEKLPSGDYNLVITLIDKNNITFKTETIFFQRRSDFIPEGQISLENIDIAQSFTNDLYRDSIPYYLNSLLPISPRYESRSILKLLEENDTTKMQQYFHSYWIQTNSINPYEGWLSYKKQVEYCEKQFSSQIKHGFETDRGRVYLQYGAPNQVMENPSDFSSVPYQIWHFYRIASRSNVRFVFYNPDLVTNDYPLLHSDMQGELQNERWQEELHRIGGNRSQNSNSTGTDKDGQFGGQSGRYFNN